MKRSNSPLLTKAQRTERREAAREAKKAKASPAASVKWLAPTGYRFDERDVPMAVSAPGAARFAELATVLATGHLEHGRRGLAICGAAFGTGVSFVAANLAIALAMSGVRTRLVEANLRTPGLSETILAPLDRPGLSEFLLDENLAAGEILHRDIIPDLSVVFAGARHGEAADLLTSERYARFAQECLRESECTIFDTAPANRAVDARVVARRAGYALLVARRGASFYEDVAMLSAQLAQDGVIVVGTILNKG
jgi:protein-tyrosine kinase